MTTVGKYDFISIKVPNLSNIDVQKIPTSFVFDFVGLFPSKLAITKNQYCYCRKPDDKMSLEKKVFFIEFVVYAICILRENRECARVKKAYRGMNSHSQSLSAT